MTSKEFYLWLNGYLEALESEEILECKIKNIRKKMTHVKDHQSQERVIFGPNINQIPDKTIKPEYNYGSKTPLDR